MVPLGTTRLVGATSVTVPLGHSSLVVHEGVYQRLVNILRPPNPAEAAKAADAPVPADELAARRRRR